MSTQNESTGTLPSLETVQEASEKIKSGKSRLSPGQPTEFTTACVPGDMIAQGDLYLKIADHLPESYTLRPSEAGSQLVPGNNQGARHVAAGPDFDIFDPPNWGKEEDSLQGPFLVAKGGPIEVQHPTHGNVTIPEGFTVECFYQREWDAEQRRERRNAD